MTSSSPWSILMDKKKPKDGGGSTTDDLALVKAAAWAWYQHGSGAEGKPMREFDATRTHQAPRPSRFQLNTVRIVEDYAGVQGQRRPQTQTPSPIDSRDNEINPLLDDYEIESISRQLDYLIESSNVNGFNGGSRFFDDNYKDLFRRQKSLSSPRPQDSKGTSTTTVQKIKKSNKFLQGFWLIRPASICCTIGDVQTRAFAHVRRLERHVPAVKRVAASRPRAAHA